jgi:hypothetical protein
LSVSRSKEEGKEIILKYGELPEITLNGETVRGLMIKIRNPAKSAIVRLPTNDELIEYLSKQREMYRDLGRRKGESQSVPKPKEDLALFAKIRIDKGPGFDEFEAGNAISKICSRRVLDCAVEGESYRITLETPFGETVHVMNEPSLRDLSLYRKNVYRAIELAHGQEERRFPPEVPVALYDSCIHSIDGYTDGYTPADVPPNHKSAVAVELVQQINELDPLFDPNS